MVYDKDLAGSALALPPLTTRRGCNASLSERLVWTHSITDMYLLLHGRIPEDQVLLCRFTGSFLVGSLVDTEG